MQERPPSSGPICYPMTPRGAALPAGKVSAMAPSPPPTESAAGVDAAALRAKVAQVLNRWPAAGLAVALVRDGRLAWFHGQGVANVTTGQPVTEDTVFRIGSLTKTVTAVAIMQLWERGLVDLDAPANDYLTAFQLTPVRPNLQPATVRHLLTHTSGVGYWRRLSDLLRPALGSGVQAARLLPLGVYYRRGLPQEIQPGTKWVYSNHGFAALGQIVEDVTGQTLADYLREHVFDPLGMEHTDLVRSDRVRPGLATGYVMRPPRAHRCRRLRGADTRWGRLVLHRRRHGPLRCLAASAGRGPGFAAEAVDGGDDVPAALPARPTYARDGSGIQPRCRRGALHGRQGRCGGRFPGRHDRGTP